MSIGRLRNVHIINWLLNVVTVDRGLGLIFRWIKCHKVLCNFPNYKLIVRFVAQFLFPNKNNKMVAILQMPTWINSIQNQSMFEF